MRSSLLLLCSVILGSGCAEPDPDGDITGTPDTARDSDSTPDVETVPPDSSADCTDEASVDFVVINEFVAQNAASATDELGNSGDWLELYNGSTHTVSLLGWTLTDDLDNPDKHELGDLELEPGGHLLLWADGAPEAGDRHLSFRLDADGEELGLFDVDGQALTRLEFGIQELDVAAARASDGSETWSYTEGTTPGEANTAR